MKAIVLLSGGLDSTTVLAIARERGFECYTLTFWYGQKHAIELAAAERVSKALGAIEHRVCEVDMQWLGGSALTSAIEVPKDRNTETMSVEIPVTYVPARNTIFLSLALAWAEVLGARDIFAGMNAVDYSGYPDCRPAFIEAWVRMARLGTRQAEINVHTPLIAMTKADIVREGVRLGIDYSRTHSCYDPINGHACGRCDSCSLRRKGFSDANIPDPTRYTA